MSAPITPHLLRDLHAYAVGRLQAGHAQAALAALGADCPDLVATYALGYLPPDYLEAVPNGGQSALMARPLAGAVIAPAFDPQGAIVDLAIWHPETPGKSTGFHGKPQGLLAPTLATAWGALRIVGNPHDLAQAFHNGHRDALWLRGPLDAVANGPRLKAAGVASLVLPMDATGDALRAPLEAAGLAIGNHGADALALLDHSPGTGLATFQAGAVRYVVHLPWDQGTRMEITMRHQGAVHRDAFDLAVAAQRTRFAGSAARRCAHPAPTIEADLVALLDAVRALQAPADAITTTGPALPAAERAQGEAFLRQGDLLEAICADLRHLGWLGPRGPLLATYLAAVSRKLPDPLWTVMAATQLPDALAALDAIAALTPPEDLVHVSRLTETALYYQGPTALRHRLLVIDEVGSLRADVLTALRVLKARGALSQSHVRKDPVTGESRTVFGEVEGPVALLTAATGRLDERVQPHCQVVPLDGDPKDLPDLLARQRAQRAGLGEDRRAIVERHHQAQRCLACAPVVIPYADRIELPPGSRHHRQDQERLLGLIEASALLHQCQRERDGAAIVATDADFVLAAELWLTVAGAADASLGPQAAALLPHLAGTFTMADLADLAALRPDWTRYAFRAALTELQRLDYVAPAGGGRGRGGRSYRVVGAPAAAPAAGRPRLREIGELAEIGETALANLSPRLAAG